MQTYNDELLLKIEKTLLIMGCGHVHPKKIAAHWTAHPVGEAEPWEMRVRSTLDALGVNLKTRPAKTKKRKAAISYRERFGGPLQVLVER